MSPLIDLDIRNPKLHEIYGEEFDTEPRDDLNEKYEYPITSSSVYGWFKPYDNMQENHNKNSVTREFYDQTHL